MEEQPQPTGETPMNAIRTRASLIRRVKNLQDQKSWNEFVNLYGPFLLRCLKRAGVSERDALDLVQDVLGIVVKNIGRFEYDRSRSFRAWLRTIAEHRAYRFYAQQSRQPAGSGGTAHGEALEDLPAAVEEFAEPDEPDWRKVILERAMQRVRQEVKKDTWQVFVLHYIEGLKPPEVAARMDMNVGAVYTAVSRVLKRLREAVEEIDESAS